MLCIGTIGTALARMTRAQHSCQAIVEDCEKLDAAVERARQLAKAGDVVLLSTGCASYDQFVNFEQRGQQFAELARGHALTTPR